MQQASNGQNPKEWLMIEYWDDIAWYTVRNLNIISQLFIQYAQNGNFTFPNLPRGEDTV